MSVIIGPKIHQLFATTNMSARGRRSLEEVVFYEAVTTGDVENVERMIQDTPEFAMYISGKKSTLHLAAEHGQDAIISLLLKWKAILAEKNVDPGIFGESHLDMQDFFDESPLEVAARKGHASTVELLLGIQTEKETISTRSQVGALKNAAMWGQNEVVKVFVRLGFDIDVLDEQETCALLYAIRNLNLSTAALLIESGSKLFNVVCRDFLLLHYAARKNSVEIARFLIENGADVNITNKNDLTPRDEAYLSQSKEVYNFLKENGGRMRSNKEYTDEEIIPYMRPKIVYRAVGFPPLMHLGYK